MTTGLQRPVNFRLPGPTPLPPAVLDAMQRPMIHHRGDELKTLFRSILERLKLIHRTEHDVFVWPGSGSAGWEAAIVNLLSPGDEVLATVIGDFGHRFATSAERLALTGHRLDRPWGTALQPEDLESELSDRPGVKAVFLTHNETSTGVTNPLRELASVVRRHGALVIVDAVSSAGGLPLLMDEWDLDVVISGSQKAWMCPPGLMITAFGPRAFEAYERSTYPRFFWDLAAARASAEQGMTPTTPPLTLLYALDAALTLILDEGVEGVWQRHAEVGEQTRRGVTELGFDLLAVDPATASNTVTAIRAPEGFTSKQINRRLLEQHNVLLQGGQGHMTDSVIRIGHMGHVTAHDIEDVLRALGSTVAELPLPVGLRQVVAP